MPFNASHSGIFGDKGDGGRGSRPQPSFPYNPYLLSASSYAPISHAGP